MQGGRHRPGLGVSDGLWSQVINQAGALLPEPALTPQRHLGRHCWSRQERGPRAREERRGQDRGSIVDESKCCAGVPRLGLGPDSVAV